MVDDVIEPMGQLSAHLDRGWDLVARGDFAGAMLSAEKSLELDETSPEAHNLLGFIHQSEGRAEDALVAYEAALEIDEGYVDAMLNAAEVLFHPLGQHEEALRWVSEALDWLEPEEVDERTDAALLEVHIHLSRGDTAAAEKLVKELPEGPFENPALPLAVGRARIDVGDFEGAEPLIRQALEREPGPDAYASMGRILESRGERREAIMMFLRSRELDLMAPEPPWALPLEQFERRVQAALGVLPPALSGVLEGALVVVLDAPGAEVVAEGVDPRAMILLDAIPLDPDSEAPEPDGPPTVSRVFVYKRNVERVAVDLFAVESEVARALEDELVASFPKLAPPTDEDAPEGDDDGGDDGGDDET